MTNQHPSKSGDNPSFVTDRSGLPSEFFRHAFRTHAESISITRLSDGTFLDVSEGFEKITGCTREEAIGRRAEDLGFYREIAGGRAAVYDRLVKEGAVQNLRLSLLTKSGESRHLRVDMDRIRHGSEECCLTVARDVTQQIEGEEDSHRNAILLRNIIDASPNSVFVKDRDGYYILVNKAMAVRNGLTPEDMVGLRDLDIGAGWFGSGADLERHRRAEQHVIDTKEPLLIPEEEYIFRDGRRSWFQTVKVPLTINGRSDCLLGIAVDITKRKQLEAAQKQTEMWLRTILTSAPLTISAADRDGQLTLLEGRGLERVGLRPGENIGASAFRLFAKIPFVESGQATDGQDVLRRALDGETIVAYSELRGAHFENHIAPLLDSDGSINGAVGVAIDVTERVKAETALRESEERYRLIFEHAGVGIGYWTADGRLVSFNRLAKKHAGIGLDDLVGQPCTEVFPGNLGRKSMERIRRAVESPDFQSYEDQIQLCGQTYWFLSTFTAVRRPDGRVAGVQIISQDLTEYRHAQSEIRKQKSVFETAEKLANIGSWEWNTDTGDVYWSQQLYTIYGREPELGPPEAESWWDYVHADDLKSVKDQLFHAIKHSGTYDTTFRIVRGDDKEIRHVHSCGRVTRNPNGRGILVVAVTQDVTKRVLAEESLRESEGMLRTLADAAFDAIFLSYKGICLDQNRTAKTMFGYSREEALGRRGTEWIAPEHRDIVMQHMLEEYEGQYEVTALRKDGSTFPCAIQARMIDFQGRRVRYTVLSDITARKRAEEKLIQSRLFADNLIQTASVMIVGLDLEGRVTLLNPAGEITTGYSAKELIGRDWFRTLIPPRVRAQMVRRFGKLQRGHMARTYENLIVTKSGMERIIAWNNSELIVDGAIVGSISFGVDITDRRNTEAQLLQLNRRLAAEQEALIDKNIALKEVLDHMDEEKRVFKHQICDSIGKLLEPLVDEMDRNGGRLTQRKMSVLRDGLDAILRKDVDDHMGNMQKLSPREMDICELIRKGLTSKVIATELGICTQTVHKHRQMIRKKLQINNKGVNLASYLRSRA